jgi:L-ascorbate metabolism protein UlaG (beta-lactamase superfamily)
MDEINWIGHASFLLRIDGKNVYIDPFNLTTVKERADIILITHPHFDHLDPNSIRRIADEDTHIFVPKDSVEKVPVGKVTGVEPNKKYSALGIGFNTVPAYNNVKERLQNHPRANGWVGYLVKMDGRTLYHAGDTDFIDEIKGLKTGVALLPMGGTYTMDVNQAAEAANSMDLDQASPMHYKQLLGEEGSSKAEEIFRKKVKKAVILKEMGEPKYSF